MSDTAGAAPAGSARLVVLVCATSFVGAALLFMVEPMIAKLVLPLFGGAPSVWNTSIFFFQASLLGGYLLTHLSIRRLGVRRQMWLQVGLVLLPVLFLPLALPANSTPRQGVPAVLWLLYVLVVTVGAPFLMLSTAGPLLQRWFGATRHPRATDPYFLFAAGNAGSLLALGSYPTLIEPNLTLHQQRTLWSGGYLVFVALILACVLLMRVQLTEADPAIGQPATPESRRIPRLRQVRWVALAFLPSSMMLGATTFVTTDIAPIPLLWVLPLSLYLLAFIVAFALPRAKAAHLSRRLAALIPALALGVGLSTVGVIRLPTLLAIGLNFALFTLVAVAAHCALAADRPEVDRLTSYYLLVAFGGALGGAFNGLIAPVLFNGLYEYPLVIAASVLLYRASGKPGWLRRGFPEVRPGIAWGFAVTAPWLLALAAGLAPGRGQLLAETVTLLVVGALALLTARRFPRAFALGLVLVLPALTVQGGSLLAERTFFGVQRVIVDQAGRHVLMHGSTVHGVQVVNRDGGLEPLSYYARTGPAGDIFAAFPAPPPSPIALIGLGAGSLAAYGRPGQRLTFYELDPAMTAIARDQRLFTYLRDSPATIDVVPGDGRLSIARAPDQAYGLIIVDAFSSDAIPVHLLTVEAIDGYLAKLRPGGWLVFHITNRHLDLAPVLAGADRARRLPGAIRIDPVTDRSRSKLPSTWVVLARDRKAIEPILAKTGWHDLAGHASAAPAWTDDFSNIFGVLKWGS